MARRPLRRRARVHRRDRVPGGHAHRARHRAAQRSSESRAASRAVRAPTPRRSRMTDADKVVCVASGQGFWGDWLEAPRRQIEGGPVDYLMLDYLAEVTMSILQKQKERDPAMGYAKDFVGAMESVLDAVANRCVKFIANAGGVNPQACADAVRTMAARQGAAGKLTIGVVTGDDLLPR